MMIPNIKKAISVLPTFSRPGSQRRIWANLWPWLVALAILGYLFARIPRRVLLHAIAAGPWGALSVYTLLQAFLVLMADGYAISVSLAVTGFRRRFGEILLARGASYVLGIINYSLGQGAFGLYLRRSGIKTIHVAGTLFFLMGINLGALLLVAGCGLLAGGYPASVQIEWPALGGVLLIGAGVYLAVIVFQPRFLYRYQLLLPFFQAGFRGHLRAFAGRLPHVLLLVLTYWGALRVWGISVPLSQGLVRVSLVLLISALPIVPMGLGTTQAALVLLFSNYAPFATPAARAAAVLAFSLCFYLMATASQAALGLWCLHRRTRTSWVQVVSNKPRDCA